METGERWFGDPDEERSAPSEANASEAGVRGGVELAPEPGGAGNRAL